MIVFPSSLLLSAPVPLSNPRIGWQTYTFDLSAANVAVSSEAADGPRDAPLRPDTAEVWSPSALPATWLLDLGALRTIDYVGIAAHNLGTLGLSVGVMLDATGDMGARLTLPAISGNYGSTPDSAAASITGDIDIRCRALLADWTPAAINSLVAKRSAAAAASTSYALFVDTTGALGLLWSTGAAITTILSTVTLPAIDGAKLWVRATLDVDNGAAGNDVTFYTSSDGVTWAQLGTVVTTGGTTSIQNGTEAVEIGSQNVGTANLLNGSVYYAEIRSLIGGTVQVKFDPLEGVTDATSFVSGTGETWTINRSGGTPARLIDPTFGGSVSIAPADDAPIVFLDTPASARYMQLTVSGANATMPRLGVIYVGAMLAMTQDVEGSGFAPLTLSRQSVLQRSLSRGGQFLGQAFRRNGVTGSVSFKRLDPDWLRAYFDGFVKSARRYPYFFAWSPQYYPAELGFVWTDKDIAPSYMGVREWMQVNWAMQGIGTV